MWESLQQEVCKRTELYSGKKSLKLMRVERYWKKQKQENVWLRNENKCRNWTSETGKLQPDGLCESVKVLYARRHFDFDGVLPCKSS